MNPVILLVDDNEDILDFLSHDLCDKYQVLTAFNGQEALEILNKEMHSELFSENILQRTGIVINGEAKSIGRTGIEMEILTGVSVAALEIYDMLKPVDTQLEIGSIKLLEKKGW